ncbi:MAG: MBL fold metallo-hydrolase [Planctomycetia bacterium]|nr:MBL fold metallo-hydrolase [Planctomycetia bacterium]
MSQQKIDIATIVSTLFGENTFVARLMGGSQCVVIDPGLEPEKVIHYLDARHLTPAAILNTHGHADHIAGNAALKDRWPDCPLVIGAGDAEKLTDPRSNLSAGFGMSVVSPPADVTVDEGDVYSAAGLDLEVRAIPGHSAGHVVFLYTAQQPATVFVGDVIFAGGIGRANFPDGDPRRLIEGIREKLFTLPDATILLPGHGPATTVGREKRDNPWVGLGGAFD